MTQKAEKERQLVSQIIELANRISIKSLRETADYFRALADNPDHDALVEKREQVEQRVVEFVGWRAVYVGSDEQPIAAFPNEAAARAFVEDVYMSTAEVEILTIGRKKDE